MTDCIVCKETTRKYKCPKCLQPYCSLDCFKQHNGSEECELNVQLRDEQSKPAVDYHTEPTAHEPFKTDDTVPQEKLQQLAASEQLKELLYNPHLRNLLNEIDTAPSAWKAMTAAMHEPLFLEFADECLKIVETRSEED